MRRIAPVLIAALLVSGWQTGVALGKTIADAPPPVQDCQEDDPCWDCETMGNKRSGPGLRKARAARIVCGICQITI